MIIECVPNFSEGRDRDKIDQIIKAIETGGRNATCSCSGVTILDTDIGEGANRTVVTFAGSPEAVVEAAFEGVRKAGEIIDMRKHHGAHPRIGATDVLPLVPVSGITLEECAELARKLAGRIYEELGIPCYCYEAAALKPERKRLEVCRAGEYESLPSRMSDPDKRPDFGPSEFNERIASAGAVNVGARNFLVAVNFDLNTKDTGPAKEIAAVLRESGYKTKEGKRIPGRLKSVKAIGWYIEEYGHAQVSMNLTDLDETSLETAYEEVCKEAGLRGLEVTGTEIIGLLPDDVKRLTNPCKDGSEA